MRGKIMFLGGLAAGFVLGARAGREKYEELVVRGRKVLDHPTVQEAAGVAQAQANRLYHEGRDKLGNSKLGEKLNSNGKEGSPRPTTRSPVRRPRPAASRVPARRAPLRRPPPPAPSRPVPEPTAARSEHLGRQRTDAARR